MTPPRPNKLPRPVRIKAATGAKLYRAQAQRQLAAALKRKDTRTADRLRREIAEHDSFLRHLDIDL